MDASPRASYLHMLSRSWLLRLSFPRPAVESWKDSFKRFSVDSAAMEPSVIDKLLEKRLEMGALGDSKANNSKGEGSKSLEVLL